MLDMKKKVSIMAYIYIIYYYLDTDPPSVLYSYSHFYFTNTTVTISWNIPMICSDSNEESSVLVWSNSIRSQQSRNTTVDIPNNYLFPNRRLFIEVYTGGSICSVSSSTLEIPSNGEDGNKKCATYLFNIMHMYSSFYGIPMLILNDI